MQSVRLGWDQLTTVQQWMCEQVLGITPASEAEKPKRRTQADKWAMSYEAAKHRGSTRADRRRGPGGAGTQAGCLVRESAQPGGDADAGANGITIEGVRIPDEFDGGISLSAFNGHSCQGSCKPIEPQDGDWTASTTWKPGDTHKASLTTKYTWDASALDTSYLFKPDVKIEGQVLSPGSVQKVNYQWSKGYAKDNPDLDQIRCDTFKLKYGTTGCVFVNSAPTYVFNAKRYPQAAAHAWLIQTKLPNHAGAKGKPLYYMGDTAQNSTNRGRICPTGWAAANGDANALDDAADKLNCDEFAFASSYNSGGMKKSEGGLNEAIPSGSTTGTPSGDACVQSFAKKHGTKVHLYNVDNGKVPTFFEVCGRSSISGSHNQESMGANFSSFMKGMRIMDKDAYWLDTRVTGTCADTDVSVKAVICTMVAK